MSTRTYIKWTPKERYQLKQLVKHHNRFDNKFNWSEIADAIETKTARQCYDQYILLFKTNDKSEERHSWTEIEEQELISSFQRSPYNWTLIKKEHFPTLGIRQLKNKYNQLVKCKNLDKSSNSSQDDNSEYLKCQKQTQVLTNAKQNLKTMVSQQISNSQHSELTQETTNQSFVQPKTENVQNNKQIQDLALLLQQFLDL
ncbi:Conserved_hypothetical protein [Hexamita inflata]|uniref:Myb-like DNA-binding domain-containing protein n=1 Tax=Hexamita inflata TaxID=28002 RepID=A0AA86NWN2_9EUKA|nr:Conserved hypothetical protein [Hexamita inflata]